MAANKATWHLLAGIALVLLLSSCYWDLGQVLFHPDVESRALESLRLPPPAPPAVNSDSFCFAVFSDLHTGDNCRSYLGEYRRHAESLGIAFCCVAGDLTHNAYLSEFQDSRQRLDSLGSWFVTIGNHDLYQAAGWQDFKEYLGPSCYLITVAGRLRLVFLDTGEGRLGSRQFNWLETQLADTGWHSSTPNWTIVITHFPLYDGRVPGICRLASTGERTRLQSLLQRHRVYAIVSGHVHGWRHTLVDSVNHFIVGTITDHLDYGRPGYLLFRVARDSLHWEHIEFPFDN